MDNIIREIEILTENKKEMLKIKNTLTAMKDAFDGLINRLEMAEERISEHEDIVAVSSLKFSLSSLSIFITIFFLNSLSGKLLPCILFSSFLEISPFLSFGKCLFVFPF